MHAITITAKNSQIYIEYLFGTTIEFYLFQY